MKEFEGINALSELFMPGWGSKNPWCQKSLIQSGKREKTSMFLHNIRKIQRKLLQQYSRHIAKNKQPLAQFFYALNFCFVRYCCLDRMAKSKG